MFKSWGRQRQCHMRTFQLQTFCKLAVTRDGLFDANQTDSPMAAIFAKVFCNRILDNVIKRDWYGLDRGRWLPFSVRERGVRFAV
jgi:hypothetical protein